MSTAVLEQACEHCGNPFTPRRSTARFCSDTCRTAHGRGQRFSEPNANGSLNRLPTVTAIRPAGPLGWEPPSEPRRPYRTAEPCPDCGELLLADPRGIWRACGACRRAVVPAAVSAPYERGTSTPQRQVISQRERDLEAIGLARRKGVMLAQLAALAADDRLHPESVPVIEWLAGQVRAAGTSTRLDDLAALAADPAAGIRRRRWWHSEPAAFSTGYGTDDEDGEDQDGDPGPAAPVARLAITAGPAAPAAGQRHAATWGGALTLLGWRLAPVIGGCQILAGGSLCGAETRHRITGGWICGRHHEQLAAVITGRNQ